MAPCRHPSLLCIVLVLVFSATVLVLEMNDPRFVIEYRWHGCRCFATRTVPRNGFLRTGPESWCMALLRNSIATRRHV